MKKIEELKEYVQEMIADIESNILTTKKSPKSFGAGFDAGFLDAANRTLDKIIELEDEL